MSQWRPQALRLRVCAITGSWPDSGDCRLSIVRWSRWRVVGGRQSVLVDYVELFNWLQQSPYDSNVLDHAHERHENQNRDIYPDFVEHRGINITLIAVGADQINRCRPCAGRGGEQPEGEGKVVVTRDQVHRGREHTNPHPAPEKHIDREW